MIIPTCNLLLHYGCASVLSTCNNFHLSLEVLSIRATDKEWLYATLARFVSYSTVRKVVLYPSSYYFMYHHRRNVLVGHFVQYVHPISHHLCLLVRLKGKCLVRAKFFDLLFFVSTSERKKALNHKYCWKTSIPRLLF